ncbi:hypothetical protein IT408_01085 [Candidatus Uhrbacteria bacterium]|nr:hypothetical protein [Candidatus Uhrbacteria bacterium]
MDRFLEKLRQFEPLLNIFVLLASGVGIYLAYQIGLQQNDINARAVQLENYVEIFVYPNQGNVNVVNVGTRPIYLKEFTLNGKTESMGGGALPNAGEHWYAIPLSSENISSGKIDLLITYEDYQGQLYESRHQGTLGARGWKIESAKSHVIGK